MLKQDDERKMNLKKSTRDFFDSLMSNISFLKLIISFL